MFSTSFIKFSYKILNMFALSEIDKFSGTFFAQHPRTAWDNILKILTVDLTLPVFF